MAQRELPWPVEGYRVIIGPLSILVDISLIAGDPSVSEERFRALPLNLRRLLPRRYSLAVRFSNVYLDRFRAALLSALFAIACSHGVHAQTFLMADGAQWQACSGTFYDSGGAAGAYGISETFTATLCPSGGPGTAPFSSITFTVWNLPVASGDVLVIHDGQDALAPVLATGSSTVSLQGQTIVSTNLDGCLTFVWTSDAATTGAGWAATINNSTDAGGSASTTICSTAQAFDLFSILTGTPDAGGQWTFNSNLTTNIYTPGISPEGVYTYTIPGTPPCTDAVATVTVDEVPAANAGVSNTIIVCSSDAAFDMRTRLLGAPQSTGSWTGPSPVVGNSFNPATMAAGVYTYTVLGTAPCPNATAQLEITVRQAPEAGSNGTTLVCSSDAAFDLFTILTGTRDAGGTWAAPGPVPHGSQFVPGTDAPGVYTYTVTGQAPCLADVSTVTVSVQAAPNAGTSTTGLICSNGTSVNMKELLGTGLAAGTWTGPSPVVNNLYAPASMVSGIYTFTVAGVAPCANATATVNMTEIAAPDAGTDANRAVCSNGANVDLFAQLGGDPDGGGTWTDPSSTSFPTGVYIPGTSAQGTYTYTVVGTFPCANDVSTVTIAQTTAPNAGGNGSLTICSNAVPVNLTSRLTGLPNVGGTWWKPTPPGGTLAGGLYDPTAAGQPAGIYTYVVAGTGPCTADSATVNVVEIQAPNAGTNGTLTLCSTNAPVGLIASLGGSPSGSGSWLSPADTPFPGGIFDPALHAIGSYKYIVTGTSPCVNDTGFVTVAVNQAPNAGANGDTALCSNSDDIQLFTVLNGTPQSGGTWSNGTGVYECGVGEEGVFTYTVVGLSPCLNAVASVTVTEERLPIAGGNGSVTLCSTEPPLNLISRLNGSPDPGGSWSPPPANGVYDPAVASQGVFTYTVTGVAPCPNASATVSVTENVAPDPGIDGEVTVCEDATSVDLFAALGGTPNAGGTWQAMGSIAPGVLTGSTFFLNGASPGDYEFRYNLPGNGQCPPAHSEVEVQVVNALNAGSNGTGNTCRTNTAYNLFNAIGSNPQPGGTWAPVGNSAILNGNFLNATQLVPGQYTFSYTLAASAGCASDASLATVNVIAEPQAGSDGLAQFCNNQTTTAALFDYLVGAETGGTWRKQGLPGIQSGSYTPSSALPENSPGVFLYILQGASPCPNDTARVTVQESTAPNAGDPTTITICATSNAFNMTSRLNGSPSGSGAWTTPGGQPHSAIFVPGVDPCGTYNYTVVGTGACQNDVSPLTILCTPNVFAGGDGDTSVCSNGSVFLLYSVLNGIPALNGVFRDEAQVVVPGGQYDPGFTGEGTFTYVVPGQSPCPNDTALVTVFEYDEPDAGISTTTQICPTGGSVNLITRLGGSPDLTGTWSNGFDGTYDPGVDPPGDYTYTVPGIAPCANDQATVTVEEVTPPDAGTSTSILRCTSSNAFGLSAVMNGSPDAGGTWYENGVIAEVFFDPQSEAPGVYEFTYVVAGGVVCPADSATLTITLNQAAEAGSNGLASFCSTSAPAPLFPFLTGSPQPGGTWRKPGGAVHSGIFNPLSDPSGVYTYRVSGTAPCVSDSATVTVTLNQAPNAGNSGFRLVCSSDDAFQLINVLSGAPNQFGTWSGPAGSPGVYDPSLHSQAVFTYTVVGVAPCPNATATAAIIENPEANAGGDAVISVCTDQSQFLLTDSLGGDPSSAGTWYDPDGVAVTGFFDPSAGVAGDYAYVVLGDSPCANDTSTLEIEVNPAPNAGISTATFVCTASGDQALVDLLGGDPALNGQWLAPNGLPHGPVFDPLSDPPGIYTHFVLGTAPCRTDSATVNIAVVAAPNAGEFGVLSACVGETALDLRDGLGIHQAGGTWTGAGQVNGIFNASAAGPGTYAFMYTVNGSGTCQPDTASVVVTVTLALNAGADGAFNVCEGLDPDLFLLLGNNAQSGGVWRDLDLTGALDGNILDASDAGEGVYDFRYVLPGSSNCPGDSALLSITVVPGPDAGDDDDNNQICSLIGQFQLINRLDGTPDPGGEWFFGSGFTPHGPVFDPDTDVSGVYTYVVPGNAGCDPDTAQVTITLFQQADAGSFGTLNICANADPVALVDHLGGTPQPGGTWTLGVNAANPLYNPAVQNPGNYVYTVQGAGPCPNATAIVQVTEEVPPNAGLNNVAAICSSLPAQPLIALLSGTPQSGGSWTGPDGSSHGALFDPSVDTSGIYTYTVNGINVCEPASAVLTVTFTVAPDAGEDSLLNVCATADDQNLLLALGPDADTGGVWTDVDGVGTAFEDGILAISQLAIGEYEFVYVVAGEGPCTGDQDTVTVVVGSGLDPGIGGSDVICGGNTAYNLFNSLGGTPSPGGVWSEASGTPALNTATGELDASQLPANTPFLFSYTVTDPGCGVVSSVLNITVTDYPDPGADGAATVCSGGPAFALFSLLGGTPQPGGSWTTSGGTPVPAVFDPATQLSGTFLYNLPGTAPCGDTTATVVITVNQPADAGADNTLTRCNAGTFDLTDGLMPGAQPGGTWQVVQGTAVLNGSVIQLDELSQGLYGFLYTVTVAGCGSNDARITLNVVDGVRVTDTLLVCNEQDRTYTVALTLSGGDPATYSVTGLDGSISDVAPFVFTSAPVLTSVPFAVVVTDANDCEPLTIDGVSPCAFEDAVFVPESFTPNGDGINDRLVIPGIEGYPANTIDIFNRWGGAVYSAAGYNNGSVAWDGTSTAALIPGELPTGTYYYVLDLGDGNEPFKGFIYLNR